MSRPFVSVVVPAYNAGQFLAETLDSARLQTYKNLEIIVVDDGSTDRTREIAESAASLDSRILVLSQPNRGVAIARNRGIEIAKGNYIAPLDADDIWLPQKIERQLAVFESSLPRPGLVYGWYDIVDVHGKCRPSKFRCELEGNVLGAMAYRNFIGGGSMPLISKVCFESVGNYDPAFRRLNAEGCEDWDLYLRIAEKFPICVDKAVLMLYRRHPHSMSMQQQAMADSKCLVCKRVRDHYMQIPARIHRWSSTGCTIAQIEAAYTSRRFGRLLCRLMWGLCNDPQKVVGHFMNEVAQAIDRRLIKIDSNAQSNHAFERLISWVNFRHQQLSQRRWEFVASLENGNRESQPYNETLGEHCQTEEV